MLSLEDVKDLICSVVAVVNERINVTERKSQNPFANRTNIYRCEDGRPICYCCLRVGHVAKYCWDRKYSCPHTPFVFVHQPAPEQSPSSAPIDVESFERDVNKLLNELQGITHDLELSNKAPFRVKDLQGRTERTVVRSEGTEKTPQCLAMEKGEIPAKKWLKESSLYYPFDEPHAQAKHTSSRLVYGVT